MSTTKKPLVLRSEHIDISDQTAPVADDLDDIALALREGRISPRQADRIRAARAR